MSYWRWLLFAAMARLDVREDVYLGIPNAKIMPRDVPVEIYRKRDSSDRSGGSNQNVGMSRQRDVPLVTFDDGSVATRIFSWLWRIGCRRS